MPALSSVPGDIPPFNRIDMLLDEAGIRNDLNIPGDEPAADYYCHYVNCIYAVIEAKGNKIGRALRQLEETIKRLIRTGKRVNRAIIVLDRLSKYEKRKFEIDRRTYQLYEKKGNTRQPVAISIESRRIPVLAVRRSDFGQIRSRW